MSGPERLDTEFASSVLFFLRLSNRKTTMTITARAATPIPTPIPAFAPVDSPDDFELSPVDGQLVGVTDTGRVDGSGVFEGAVLVDPVSDAVFSNGADLGENAFKSLDAQATLIK